MEWIQTQLFFDGRTLLENRVIAVEHGRITDIIALSDLPADAIVTQRDTLIGPGLFDVQVNGGAGVMLNNDPTPEGVSTIARAHAKTGTAFLLPTVITDRFEVIQRAAFAVLDQVGKNGVLGIHIEGPHINPVHCGTHNLDLIRPFDNITMELLKTLRHHNLPVLLTLAPELLEPGVIAKLDKMGVIVSAGHSAASAEETERALAEGLRCFTHLFNGMPSMLSRAPGLVGAAINSNMWCGIIADGHHVDDRMVALACRARPVPNRMVLVSDATSTVNGPDSFELYGEVIHVQGGKLVNAAGSLAGAHIDLKTSVMRAVNNVGISLSQAIAMATSNPRQMMNIPMQNLIGSKFSELSFFDTARFHQNSTTMHE